VWMQDEESESKEFIPKNELEVKLIDAQNGVLSPPEFMAFLMKTELYMPIYDKHGIAGFQSSSTAHPLLLEDENAQKVLCLFSSPDRAKAVAAAHPGYEGGLLVEIPWILEKMGVSYGIIINPDWPVGLVLEPEVLRQLLH